MSIFVDSNIPMYLVGGDHPNRDRTRALLEVAVAARQRLVTDAETFQELLHRYVAINRREAIEPAWNALRRLVDETLPIELEDVERARQLVLTSRLGARDALHTAVMQRHDIPEILTFDTAFDQIPGIRRRA
ncbi:MAG TPA: type II toxin-antitoxin system VapC family toxin [Candidatus Limnocylindrales bacterium]|nr:type II toxin-antitoxin system VapC family toxin [Candidatus Limnocylindrales bacterium]